MAARPTLMVPVHLDALVLSAERGVVAATADFSLLPYRRADNGHGVNRDTAYLSEELLSAPFENEQHYLRPGVHLHWALPDALTRGARPRDAQEDDEAPAVFPLVPDRWLVLRTQAEGTVEQAWVVESNYLHPEGQGGVSGSPTFPLNPPPEAGAPYRHLGRVLPAEGWQEGAGASYLRGLTAVGYGEPTFAALYANCRNVFGMYDPAYIDPPPGLRYYVIGWHSTDDYLQATIAALKASAPNELLSPELLLERLAERAGWGPAVTVRQEQLAQAGAPELWDELVGAGWLLPWPNDPAQASVMSRAHRAARPLRDELAAAAEPAETLLRGLEEGAAGQIAVARALYYARLSFGRQPEQPDASAAPQPQIVVANTGPQALAVYLARQLAEQPAFAPIAAPDAAGKQPSLEERLEALLLAQRLRDRSVDLDAAFREARHEAGFTAVRAGHAWTLRQQSRVAKQADAKQADAARAQAAALARTQPELFDQLSHLLNRLNSSQLLYDRATHELDTLRRQLFADWYRYQLCLYPPEGEGTAYPDVNAVQDYIAQVMLPLLQACAAATGRLSYDDDGDPFPVAEEGGADTLAARVAAAGVELRAAIAGLNALEPVRQANLAYRLGRVDAPRFWQPNNPVVLLAGEEVRPTLRHGQDGRARPDGLLACALAGDELADGAPPTQAAALIDLVDRRAAGGAGDPIGSSSWGGQPWHPLLLEWEVELYPTVGRGELDPMGDGYDPAFITANYELREDAPELWIRPDRGALSRGANCYAGASILTPYAHSYKARQLATYVANIYCKATGQAVPPPEQTEEYLRARRPQIAEWHTGLGHDDADSTDSLAIALAAFDALQGFRALSQALGGFNEALLGRRQTFQLPVGDPLAFADDRPFIEAVRAAVGRGNSSAPLPLNDFNPIRSGALRLLRLRLVDTFGRVRELNTQQVLTPQHLDAGGEEGLVALPPRFVQPARLNLRWLTADQGDQELGAHATETPVCGWLLLNQLDESVMLYDGDGRAVGAVAADRSWRPPAGAPPADEPDPALSPHLLRLIRALRHPDRNDQFLKRLLATLDSALQQIDPASFAQHQDLALLMGRPLALVRASLSLEIQGLPTMHQGWNQLRLDMVRDTRDSDGFPAVRLPVRLGDDRQLNDGLAGYWLEADDELLPVFYAPLATTPGSDGIKTHADGEVTLAQAPADPAQTLTMLFDPRGTLHAACGALPVKVIDIPPEHYRNALRRIEVTFLAGPVLAGAGGLGLPLPGEPGLAWSWLEAGDTPDKLRELTPPDGLVSPDAVPPFAHGRSLREGWLRLRPADDQSS